MNINFSTHKLYNNFLGNYKNQSNPFSQRKTLRNDTVCFSKQVTNENFSFASLLAFGSNKAKLMSDEEFETAKAKLEEMTKDDRIIGLTRDYGGPFTRYLTKENIALVKKLYTDRKFPKTAIHLILEEKNPKLQKTKLECASGLNGYISNPSYAFLLPYIKEDNCRLAKLICSDKEYLAHIKKESSLTYDPLNDILKTTRAEDEKFAIELWKDKDFPKRMLSTVLLLNNPEDRKFLIDLVKEVYADKECPEEYIGQIASEPDSNLRKEKQRLIKKVLQEKNLSSNVALEFLEALTPENIALADKLCDDKNFPNSCISYILGTNDAEAVKCKIDMVKWLLLKGFKDDYISSGIDTIQPFNVNFAKKLFSEKKLDKYDISYLLHHLTKYNIEIAEMLYSDKELFDRFGFKNPVYNNQAMEIIQNTKNGNKELAKQLCYDKDFPAKYIVPVLSVTNSSTLEIAREICKDKTFPMEFLNTCFKNNLETVIDIDDPESIMAKIEVLRNCYPKAKSNEDYEKIKKELRSLDFKPKYYLSKLSSQNIKRINDIYNKQVEKCLAHPELYDNGRVESIEATRKNIKSFLNGTKYQIKLAADILGEEALDDLLRYRIESAMQYLGIIACMTYSNMALLKGMVRCKKPDGTAFISTEKAEMIDTFEAFKRMDFPADEISNMVQSGVVDIPTLHKKLLEEIFRNSSMTEDEIKIIPEERISAWDLRYTHFLANELLDCENDTFKDFIKMANLYDAHTYLHDVSNKYGQANIQTKEAFEKFGLNYDFWIKPPKNCEVEFRTSDTTSDKLKQITEQISEDIETLRNTSAKKFIDKRFAKFIKDDKFVIPKDISANKIRLENLVKDLLTQFNTLWKRAQKNKTSPNNQISNRAKNALMIKSHLEQRMKDIKSIKKSKQEKALNWRIKMWDRNPQKDIFQGNYSTCCIGMTGGNASAMPHYIMNTMFNMIEIVDEQSGETVGNALCYYATNAAGKTLFIIDNVEINNQNKPSDTTGIKLRNAIAQYAKNINKKVTGTDKIPVVMGTHYNDIPTDDLTAKNKINRDTCRMIGDIDCDEIYCDTFGGWVPTSLSRKISYFNL